MNDKIPWIEKYRPQKLDDIMHQEEIKRMLKQTIKTGQLQHLLLYGPAGTGKTSTILAVARELYGPKYYKNRTVELNASDERGIGIVRNKIGRLAKTSNGKVDKNYPSPPYKIIILDEADAMTNEAQSALRKTMEDYSHITRFCFICNYINKIIEPIASRCVKFRFKPLTPYSMYKKLNSIAKCEKININEKCLNRIIHISDGDMRKAITLLQNTIYIKENITQYHINEIANILPSKYLTEIEKVCFNKEIDKLSELIELTKKITRTSYPIINVIKEITNHIIKSPLLNDLQKSSMCIVIADSERKVIAGADRYIQLLYILSNIKYVFYYDKPMFRLNLL